MDGDDVSVTDIADGRVSTTTVVCCDVDADEVGVVTLETHDVIAVLLSVPVVVSSLFVSGCCTCSWSVAGRLHHDAILSCPVFRLLMLQFNEKQSETQTSYIRALLQSSLTSLSRYSGQSDSLTDCLASHSSWCQITTSRLALYTAVHCTAIRCSIRAPAVVYGWVGGG